MFDPSSNFLKSNKILYNGIVLKSCYVKLSKKCDVPVIKNNSKLSLDLEKRCSIESDSSISTLVICSDENLSKEISSDRIADKSTNDETGSLFSWHNSSDTDLDEENETHTLTYFADKFKNDIADCDYKSRLSDSSGRKYLSSNATTSTLSISDIFDDSTKLKLGSLNIKNKLESSVDNQLQHNQSKMQCSEEETKYNLKHCAIVLKKIATKEINEDGKITGLHKDKVMSRNNIKPLYISSDKKFNSSSESFKSVSTSSESDSKDNINYSNIKSNGRKTDSSSIKKLKLSPRKVKYSNRNNKQEKRNNNDSENERNYTTLKVSNMCRKHSKVNSDSESSCDLETLKKSSKNSKVTSDCDLSENFKEMHHTRQTRKISSERSSSENLNLKHHQRKHSELSSDSKSSCDLEALKKCNKKSKVISDSEDSSKNVNLKHHKKKCRMRSDTEDLSENFKVKHHARKTSRISGERGSCENLNLKHHRRKYSELSSDSESSSDLGIPKKCNKKSKVISDSEDCSKNVNLKHHERKSRVKSITEDSSESFNLKHHTRQIRKISSERSSSENANLKHHQRKRRIISDSENSFQIKYRGKNKLTSDSKSLSQNLNLKKHNKKKGLLQDSKSFKTLRKHKNPNRLSFGSNRTLERKSLRKSSNVISYRENSPDESTTSDNESAISKNASDTNFDTDHSGYQTSLSALLSDEKSSVTDGDFKTNVDHLSYQNVPKELVRDIMLKKKLFEEKGEVSHSANHRNSKCVKTIKILDNESASEAESVPNSLTHNDTASCHQANNNKRFSNKLQKKSTNEKGKKNIAMEDENSGSCIESLIGECYVSDSSDTNCSFKTKTGEKYVVKFCAENVMKLNVTVNLKDKGGPNKNDTNHKSNSFELSETCRFGCNSKPFCCLKMHKITKIINKSSIYDKENDKSLIKIYDDETSNTSDSKSVESMPEISTRKNVDRNCIKCLIKFSNQKEEFNHICKEKQKKGFLCEYCEEFSLSYRDLENHLRIHQKELSKNYDDNSNKNYKNSDKKNLKESKSANFFHDISERNCVQCSVKFSSKNEEYNHLCSGKKEKGFLCEYCEKLFSSFNDTLQHIRFIHKNIDNNSDKSKVNLDVSSELVYKESTSTISSSNTSKHSCVKCSVKFSTKNEEYNHLCKGKGEKGFLCECCKKLFSSYRAVMTHERFFKRNFNKISD